MGVIGKSLNIMAILKNFQCFNDYVSATKKNTTYILPLIQVALFQNAKNVAKPYRS